jgi:hypothetical protein
MKFSSFLDKKVMEAKRRLGVIRDVLSESDIPVKDFLKSEDPYLFVEDPDKEMEFGIRIYKVGSRIAYRIQRESDTQPYGEAYPMDVEKYFSDLVTDMDEDEAADKIKKALVEEVKSFFKKSSKANDDMLASKSDDATGRIIVSANNGDLSNSM